MANKLIVEDVKITVNKSHPYYNIEVKLDDNLVFSAGKDIGKNIYPLGYNSSAFWQVDPNKSKEDYLGRLIQFYKALKVCGSEEVTLEAPNQHVRYRLDDLKCDLSESLLQHPRWKDFYWFDVGTPSVCFSMENTTPNSTEDIWTPETGIICVRAYTDLSIPVAELIADTAKYTAPAEQLQQILKERVYNFRE